MSHEIDMTSGKAACFSARGITPWHGLGKVITEDAVTSADAIKFAGLDYSLFKNPLWSVNGDGKTIEVPNNFAIVRGDTGGVLGVVGKNYEIFQNSQAFSFFDTVIGQKLAVYETAGALFDGRIVWILAKLPAKVFIKGTDDVTDSYVLLSTSHDGSRGVTIMPTMVRVVCNNTLTMALGEYSCAEGVRLRHTKAVHSKAALVSEKLGIINTKIEEYDTQINGLSKRKITKQAFDNYITTLFPDNENSKSSTRTENIRLEMENNYEYPEFDLTGGTAWAAFNAVTKYVDHQRTNKGSDSQNKMSNRMFSNLLGVGATKKNQAFNLAMSL